MSFDAILTAFFGTMGGPPLLLFLCSLIIVASVAAAIVRPFMGYV